MLSRTAVPEAGGPGIRKLQPVPPEELTRYAGNEACASCHADIVETHSTSEHAQAMSRVTAGTHGTLFKRPSDVEDPKRGMTYTTGVEGGKCVLVAQPKDGAPIMAEATWGFGSGKHGITYLGQQGPTELELRLSYYPGPKRWSFSPGQQLKNQSGGIVMETGLLKARETVEGCFVCHSTVIGKDGGQLLTNTVMMGVGCESCHGPGRDHITAMRQGEKKSHLVDLKRLNGQQISTELCGQCHRSPAGEDPHDPFNRVQLPRLQGLALSKSLCFTNSNGKLSCLSCHDPHDQEPKPASFYDGQCKSCHSGASAPERACPVDPVSNCVSCHMPKQTVGMPFGLAYNTHWIKVWAGR